MPDTRVPPPGDRRALHPTKTRVKLLRDIAGWNVYQEAGQCWSRHGERKATAAVAELATAGWCRYGGSVQSRPGVVTVELTTTGAEILRQHGPGHGIRDAVEMADDADAWLLAQTPASPDPRDAGQPDTRPAEGVPGIAAGHPHPGALALAAELRAVADALVAAASELPADVSLYLPIAVQVTSTGEDYTPTAYATRTAAVDILARHLGLPGATERATYSATGETQLMPVGTSTYREAYTALPVGQREPECSEQDAQVAA